MTDGPPPILPSDNQDKDRSHDSPSSFSPRSQVVEAAADPNAQNAASNAKTIVVDFANSSRLSDNSTLPPSHPASQIQFRSNTIAPSPPLAESVPSSPVTSSNYKRPPSPLAGGSALRLQTDVPLTSPSKPESITSGSNLSSGRPSITLQHKTSASSLLPVSRTPSFKTAIANSIGTISATSSAFPSPIISAMGDVTPLPSPLLSCDSPGPWKRLGARPPSRELQAPIAEDSVLMTSTGESIASALANASKRKAYTELVAEGVEGPQSQQPHTRNRSVSEYVPDPMLIPKRQTTVSGTHIRIETDGTAEPQIRREANLAESRGLTPITKPPTPPPSESSKDSSEKDSVGKIKSSRFEYFEAYGQHDRKLRRWRAIKMLGQGTFSRVMLATSQAATEEEEDALQSGILTPTPEAQPDRKTLVAVKVCEHGPRGGASEDRIEMSLKRELEIMQCIHHPSLVHLKAWNIELTRAILVLSYCPGGDLFDVATTHREVLKPTLLRRMFSELVGAVGYLHERRIVHRDIKLENVLVNIPASELADPSTDWTSYPYSVVMLTDLGLSRRIADDEKLETRCGSDDYAAPEVIMGQPYDGRATDAWSLGVLLYALLEARLPFDPNPGMSDAHRMRSRTSHRIARVEWRWIVYAGEDGDHEGSVAKFREQGLLGAMEITEGLLKRARSRWPLEKVAKMEWVSGGIKVEGGLQFREEEEGEEVL